MANITQLKENKAGTKSQSINQYVETSEATHSRELEIAIVT